ncbi:hypothetical protein GCM10010462_09110 [Microbacterium dextranolyticum]|uniref:Uncharacterized protein n=1 Tax=Microbacterium dextranolyticum TaxID=36806 RepID=A0A9W6M749_9MICO|nr:hypothetical protein GCM10017591_23780 [Microbacterium dextranolyticum]
MIRDAAADESDVGVGRDRAARRHGRGGRCGRAPTRGRTDQECRHQPPRTPAATTPAFSTTQDQNDPDGEKAESGDDDQRVRRAPARGGEAIGHDTPPRRGRPLIRTPRVSTACHRTSIAFRLSVLKRPGANKNLLRTCPQEDSLSA